MGTTEAVGSSPNISNDGAKFVEQPETRARVIKLLNKATRAQYVHFRYEYSVKCCMKGTADFPPTDGSGDVTKGCLSPWRPC